VVADAALGGAPLAIVDDAVAGIDFYRAIVESDRHRDDHLALGGIKVTHHALVEIQYLYGRVKAVQHGAQWPILDGNVVVGR
jgi:hypothetical protein